jgi:hypothetical protein
MQSSLTIALNIQLGISAFGWNFASSRASPFFLLLFICHSLRAAPSSEAFTFSPQKS